MGDTQDGASAPPSRQDVAIQPAQANKPAPIRFSNFFTTLSLPEQIRRVARYAENPLAYIEDVLGKDTLQQRRRFLSIPTVEDVVRDVYGAGAHKEHFEQHIAQLLGKKHGLFFVTGVQAQLAVVKIHCERASNNRAAWHVSSHLESAEMKSYKELYGLDRVFLGRDANKLPTVAEVKEVLERPSNERPAVVLVEIPNRVLGCATYTFDELQQLSAACKEAGVKFHMDGARLWEIEPHYQAVFGKTFADICALFDTVYVSMYKGLTGAAGAVLVTDDFSLREEAKVWQRRAGGNAITLYYEVLDSERGFNENIGTFAARREKMLDVAAAVLDATKKFTNSEGRPIVFFIPKTPTCCQTRTGFDGFTGDELDAARDRVQEKTNVRLYDKLKRKETLDETIDRDLKTARSANKWGATGPVSVETNNDRVRDFECFINAYSEKVDISLFVDTYVAFCEELLAGR